MSGAQCGIVTFDYAIWIGLYPEFAAVPQQQVENYFDLACTVVDNSPTSIIPVQSGTGVPIRARVLGMTTAHLTALFVGVNGGPAPQAVGRVSNGTEGSVTVALDMGPPSATAAWWNQTKYGALAWMALRPYRSMRFFPAPRPYLGVGSPGQGIGGYSSFRGSTGWNST